ncbi:hypothetical protein AL037_01580 [Salipiger aestuarii]|nr:hypothetical protein AL037_01580 [Salipiger aestuarii]
MNKQAASLLRARRRTKRALDIRRVDDAIAVVPQIAPAGYRATAPMARAPTGQACVASLRAEPIQPPVCWTAMPQGREWMAPPTTAMPQ